MLRKDRNFSRWDVPGVASLVSSLLLSDANLPDNDVEMLVRFKLSWLQLGSIQGAQISPAYALQNFGVHCMGVSRWRSSAAYRARVCCRLQASLSRKSR